MIILKKIGHKHYDLLSEYFIKFGGGSPKSELTIKNLLSRTSKSLDVEYINTTISIYNSYIENFGENTDFISACTTIASMIKSY